MNTTAHTFKRRDSLKTIGPPVFMVGWPALSFGEDFPERALQVYIPTRAGGGADRNFRSFSSVLEESFRCRF